LLVDEENLPHAGRDTREGFLASATSLAPPLSISSAAFSRGKMSVVQSRVTPGHEPRLFLHDPAPTKLPLAA